MKIFLTGGTGFVGSYLTRRLAQMGHQLTIVTRSPQKGRAALPGSVTLVQGDPTTPGPWQQSISEHDTIINLAGTSIFTIWTARTRKSILESRILTTRNLVDALAGAKPGTVLLSTSAVGYYGGRSDDKLLDESSPPGNDFLAEVGRRWEAEALRAEEFGVRVILCRFGIVLGRNGGALSKMVPAFKYFLGSPLGSGMQWFPWIHEEDLLRAMLFLCEKEHISGPVNLTAPDPVRNREMTRILAETLHRPVIMPTVPAFVLKAALGEFGQVLLQGQRAVPRRLTEEGFQFQFPTFKDAVTDLID